MPRQISPTELECLIDVVGTFPDGASTDEIARAPGIELSRRTLQRRLAALVESERLILEGRGRGSRYRVPRAVAAEVVPVKVSTGEITVGLRVSTGIAVSPEGESVRQSVGAPIQARRPVGYDRAFLDRYRPNEDVLSSRRGSSPSSRAGQLPRRGTSRRNVRAEDPSSASDRSLVEFQPPGRQHLLAAGDRTSARAW